MNELDKSFLLQSYGEENGPEAGPWNTSLESKYLEYRITAFFEKDFEIGQGAQLCNIGIGAGNWDRYLSYRLNGGNLTSIDLDGTICVNSHSACKMKTIQTVCGLFIRM